jgi:phage shock protein A
MFRAARRLRANLGDRTSGLRHRAAPEVRLERAIQGAHDQHRQLQDQAAELYDERQEVETRLRAATAEREDLAAKTEAATRGAEEATAAGRAVQASELTAAAASFASRLAAVERELTRLQDAVDRVALASDEATASAVQQAWVLQEQLAEGHRRLEGTAEDEDAGG